MGRGAAGDARGGWEEGGSVEQSSTTSRRSTPNALPRPPKGAASSLELQMGWWSRPPLTPGWGKAGETGNDSVFPIAY